MDTLKLSKRLQQAAMPKDQAEALADGLAEAVKEDMITKQDLQIVKSDLELRTSELELRLVKMITESKNQILLAIGLLILAQIGLHFWH
jgi:hypothetical protein